MGVTLTYHVNIEEDDLVQPVLDVGDRFGNVHIGESHRGCLGSGHLDFPLARKAHGFIVEQQWLARVGR